MVRCFMWQKTKDTTIWKVQHGDFATMLLGGFTSKGWMKFWLRKLIKENTNNFMAHLQAENFTVMKRGFPIIKRENTSGYINSHMCLNTLFHLLDCLHKCMKNIPYKNCMYKLPSWWWTHVVRNMQKTSKIELKH